MLTFSEGLMWVCQYTKSLKSSQLKVSVESV